MYHRSPARPRRRRRRFASIATALTLTTALVAVPVTSAVAATEDRAPEQPGISGPPSSAGGAYPGWGPGGGPMVAPSTSSTAGLELTDATTDQSAGLVLVSSIAYFGESQAAGTGIIIDETGVVVTNHHVVEGATSVEVTVASTGETYEVTVLGTDPVRDIAVLDLEDASQLETVDVDTGDLDVGDDVTAVGDAGGDGGELSAAAGTVTALRKSITVGAGEERSRLRNLIEVDADVISGVSGGALLDAADDVIGMNVAASSGSTDITGYAIPVSRVLRIADQILEGDDSDSVVIGQSAMLGISLYRGSTRPLVASVTPDSPAEELGIEAGATITAVDGTAASSASRLTDVLGGYEPGDRVTVTWTDASGNTQSGDVDLAAGPVA